MNRWCKSTLAAWAVVTAAAHAALEPAAQESRPRDERAVVVQARAVDEAGIPVPGVTLHLFMQNVRTQPSGADGRIRGVLEAATPTVYDDVEFRCAGRATVKYGTLRFDRGQPCDLGTVVIPALAPGESSRDVRASLRPAALPTSWPATIRSGLKVRVTAAGAPVPQASVAVHPIVEVKGAAHFGTPRSPALEVEVTGPNGIAELDTRANGVVVRVEAKGFAPVEQLFPPLSGAPEPHETEIALGAGGTIEGRVITATGFDPTSLLVRADRGDGMPKSARVDASGRFRMTQVMPSPWRIEAVDGWGTDEPDRAWLRKRIALGPHPAPVAQIDDGRATQVDLDLTSIEPCDLAGELVVDGKPASGWFASIAPSETAKPRAARSSSARLGADGRFTLRVLRQGAYHVAIAPRLQDVSTLRFVADLDLKLGRNAWRLDVSTGRVLGERATRPLLYAWRAPGVAACWIPIVPDADGRFALDVPSGRGRIVDPSDSAAAADGEWPTVVSVDVVAGGTARVQLP